MTARKPEARKTNAVRHDPSVCYTINDDGIWLCCPCGWETCVGFTFFDSLARTVRAHRASVRPVAQKRRRAK